MSKMRVHELAKELNVANKDIIQFLEGKNIEVKSHMSAVDDEHVAMVKAQFAKKEAKKEAKPEVKTQEVKAETVQEKKPVEKTEEKKENKKDEIHNRSPHKAKVTSFFNVKMFQFY